MNSLQPLQFTTITQPIILNTNTQAVTHSEQTLDYSIHKQQSNYATYMTDAPLVPIMTNAQPIKPFTTLRDQTYCLHLIVLYLQCTRLTISILQTKYTIELSTNDYIRITPSSSTLLKNYLFGRHCPCIVSIISRMYV